VSLNINEINSRFIPRDLYIKLQAVYDTLKSAERKAANLLIDDPKLFAGFSISQAAISAGCSEATLVRLARKLGYGGYPELKLHIREAFGDNPAYLYDEISEKDNCDVIVEKVFSASVQALNDTLNVLDKEEYRKANDAICHAKKIVFYGVGDAANVAQSGFQKFLRLGVNVFVSTDMDIQFIFVSQLVKGDVLIVISHSGKTKNVVDVVKYAKVTGATVICITNYPSSPLAKNSDIVLLTATFVEHFIMGEVISKRIAELCIIESLFINYLLIHKDKLVENLERSNIALANNKL